MIKSLLFLFLFAFCQVVFSQAIRIDEFKQDSAFLETPFKVINKIIIVGNKVTKAQIVQREITFAEGDTLSNEEFAASLQQSKKNLLNTSLFNFAKFDVALRDSVHLVVVLQLVERWYLFPLPIFEIDDNNFNTWWRDRDYSRINYGMHLTLNNFRGRKEKLSFTAKYGFTERYRLKYDIPYINKQQKSGLSFSFSYNRKDEIVYSTFNNERVLYKSETRDAVRNYSSGVTYRYRPKIFTTHAVGLEHDYNSVLDSVVLLNPNFLGDGKRTTSFLSLYYSFANDKRDSRNYPLKGHFLRLSVKKYGLGFLQNQVDLTNFSMEIKKYIPIGEKLYWAGSLRGVVAANNNQPYLLQNGLGYNSFSIRSYEFYVIDGQNIGLAKTQLRYQLVKPRSADLGFVTERFGKFHYAFYLGVFTDLAYVQDNVGFPQNRLANQIQFGSGIGLDFVSYYDIVLRTEFSVNKFGESGIFLHFVAPI